MGLFSSLFGSKEESQATHPCNNCESDCTICPDACEECSPYKKQLVDLLYNVDHLEEFRAKYEVVSSETANVGSCSCPACGAPNPITLLTCEYCGSAIRESDGKIRVNSANDIPNPILEAQELIYQRRAMIQRYSGSGESSGLLNAISNLLSGESDQDSLGTRMTEEEIQSAADYYGVSLSSYLQGLDNGKYRTYDEMRQQNTTPATGSTYAGGAAGVGAGAFLGSQMHSQHRPPMPPQNNRPGNYGHPQGQSSRPPQHPQSYRPNTHSNQGPQGNQMTRPGHTSGSNRDLHGGNRSDHSASIGGNRPGSGGGARRDSGNRSRGGNGRGPGGGGRGPGR